MADTSFSQTQVSFNHIYETAKKPDYEQIFDSDFIFLLYTYSKNDKWLIQDIAQACVNYTTVNTEITTDTCKNFVKDIIGIEGTDSTIATDDKFVLTTTANTTEFKFKIFATGNYNIDCGNNKAATKSGTEYICKYDNAGQYNITVTGLATDYPNEQPAISFQDNTNLAKISGSLGSVFPTLPGKQPIFRDTFYGCTNLTSIPNGLFSGISGAPAKGMFKDTFEGCRGLTSIPDGLFSGISGAPAEEMFYGTFYKCTGLTSIPDGLFSGISGAPAGHMFYYTFGSCTGLKSIPNGLFSKISGAPAKVMFKGTFADCTGLKSIPDGLFSGISGAPASEMFSGTFYNCTGLKSIPDGLFSGISGAPAEYMFYYTFENCTGLKSIPDGLFGKISGAPAGRMFRDTFRNCSGLKSIPDDLFSKISGASAEHMFEGTFNGCTSLTGTITPEFFGNITPPITRDYLTEEDTFKGTHITVND